MQIIRHLSLHKSTTDTQHAHKSCIFYGACVQHVVLVAAQICSCRRHECFSAASTCTSTCFRGSNMCRTSYLSPKSHFSFLSLVVSSCPLIIPKRSWLWGQRLDWIQSFISNKIPFTCYSLPAPTCSLTQPATPIIHNCAAQFLQQSKTFLSKDATHLNWAQHSLLHPHIWFIFCPFLT